MHMLCNVCICWLLCVLQCLEYRKNFKKKDNIKKCGCQNIFARIVDIYIILAIVTCLLLKIKLKQEV